MLTEVFNTIFAISMFQGVSYLQISLLSKSVIYSWFTGS